MNPSLPDFIVNRLKMISGKTIERKGCQANLAFDVGRHHSYVSEVMNGYRFLDDEERKIWAKELDLEPEDFPVGADREDTFTFDGDALLGGMS